MSQWFIVEYKGMDGRWHPTLRRDRSGAQICKSKAAANKLLNQIVAMGSDGRITSL